MQLRGGVCEAEGRRGPDRRHRDRLGSSEEASQHGKSFLYLGQFGSCFCQLQSLLVLFCSRLPSSQLGEAVSPAPFVLSS